MSLTRSGHATPGFLLGRIRQLQLRRDPPVAGGLTVNGEALDPGRPLIPVEMDPDAVDLCAAAAVAPEPPAPSGRDRRLTAGPGDEVDLLVLEKWLDHVDPDPAQEPEVLRQAPTGLLDVLDRHVLKESSRRVDPHAAVRSTSASRTRHVAENVRPVVGTGMLGSSTAATTPRGRSARHRERLSAHAFRSPRT